MRFQFDSDKARNHARSQVPFDYTCTLCNTAQTSTQNSGNPLDQPLFTQDYRPYSTPTQSRNTSSSQHLQLGGPPPLCLVGLGQLCLSQNPPGPSSGLSPSLCCPAVLCGADELFSAAAFASTAAMLLRPCFCGAQQGDQLGAYMGRTEVKAMHNPHRCLLSTVQPGKPVADASLPKL